MILPKYLSSILIQPIYYSNDTALHCTEPTLQETRGHKPYWMSLTILSPLEWATYLMCQYIDIAESKDRMSNV
jgi:hypothetical protein